MVGVGFLIILLTIGKSTKGFVVIDENEDVNEITRCATGIFEKYFTQKFITVVNINSNEDAHEIIKSVNNMLGASIVLRDTNVTSIVQNVQYFVTAASTEEFVQEFPQLPREATWCPKGKFLIVIKNLKKNDLVDIFNTLLDAHVVNAVVLNGSKSVGIYSYNPFENYGCGKSFERITYYGRCIFPLKSDLYPNKLVTGLRNCTFRALVSHFPPFIIDPEISKKGLVGIEQYAFNTVSELEGFKVEYLFGNFGETWSTIDEKNVAHGVLRHIQTKDVDALFGFMSLTSARGAAFDFLFGHLAFNDEFTYFVRRAGPVSPWKNLYLIFTMTVWLMILASFVSYAILMITLIRGRDRVFIIFKMVDALVLHGSTIRASFMVKVIYLTWIWFAYLINSIYQCSLFGLTTHPIIDYQVKDVGDLKAYNYEPCVSSVINEFMKFEANVTFKQTNECKQYLHSALYVSENQGVYTILSRLRYLYTKFLYLDVDGKSKLWQFEKAINKLIYAIYLYKGFPMYDRLHVHTLRLQENGLMHSYFEKLYHEQKNIYPALGSNGESVYRVFIPWSVFSIGVAISTITFILEILVHTKRRRSKKLEERCKAMVLNSN